MSLSQNFPTRGFAVTPEYPSLPPHFKPTFNLEICTFSLLNVSAYAFVLLVYAYYLRCKYIHGNKATILFAAYHDAELAALRVVNRFLSEYLKQAIPETFNENYFTEGMYNSVRITTKTNN